MATHPDHVKSVAAPLQGSALAIYFVLLPFVVVAKWGRSVGSGNGTLVRVLLVVLALFWIVFLAHVIVNVWRLRRGADGGNGGSAWLAGLVVAVLPFLIPAALVGTAPAHSVVVAQSQVARETVNDIAQRTSSPSPTPGPKGSLSSSDLGTLPLALMAKRRSDLIRQHQFTNEEAGVDATIQLLRALNPALIAQVRQLIGDRTDGVIEVPDEIVATSGAASSDSLIACSLGRNGSTTLVSFAREGGRLAILPQWTSDDVTNAVVALHDGKLVFAVHENDLLRALATRTVRNTLVIYLGHGRDLDDELASCSITLAPYLDTRRPVMTSEWVSVVPTAPTHTSDVRVDLLRADPQVLGLCEPLTPTLRRRGIEMLAYLALHRHEPVTGDRLRTRVLTHADVDASTRTLANTASVVRRSAGADAAGTRLHAVTSSGLYVTHGITSDVEVFTTLVGRARQLANDEAAPLAHQALAMVKGEPLASALRGFEWFLAEGYGARLSRDGEWAALALHHDAVAHGRYELAFWALRQGLLIDPYSDVLLEASARVPRLREFGGDGGGLAQDETVGPGRAEAMSWSFNGLSNQVTE